MSNIIVVGLWGAGKTSFIRNHLHQLLADGSEGLVSIGPALLSGQVAGPDSSNREPSINIRPYASVCADYVERLVKDREAAEAVLAGSNRREALTPRWTFDGLMFNVPLYGTTDDRGDFLHLERTLSEHETSVKYLHVPASKLVDVCVTATVAERGEKWRTYLDQVATDYKNGLEEMLHLRMTSLEGWLSSTPLRVEVVDRGSK